MPSASEEQRVAWGGADGIGEDKAEAYLRGRGFVLTPDWCWILPADDYRLSASEISAMDFLVDEWDYGWCYTPSKYAQRVAQQREKRRNGKRLLGLAPYASGPTILRKLQKQTSLLEPAPRWRPRVRWLPASQMLMPARWIIRGQVSLRYTTWRGLVPLYYLRALWGG